MIGGGGAFVDVLAATGAGVAGAEAGAGVVAGVGAEVAIVALAVSVDFDLRERWLDFVEVLDVSVAGAAAVAGAGFVLVLEVSVFFDLRERFLGLVEVSVWVAVACPKAPSAPNPSTNAIALAINRKCLFI